MGIRNVIYSIISQNQRKKHKARIDSQYKIDNLLTNDNLKRAWNSQQSKEYNKQYYGANYIKIKMKKQEMYTKHFI